MRLYLACSVLVLGVLGTWAAEGEPDPPVRVWSECSKECEGGTRKCEDPKGWSTPCNQFECEVLSPCPCSDMDILFVLDRSKSIGERNYWIVKQFLMDTIETIRRMGGAAGSRLAVLTFDYGARTEIDFSDGVSLENPDDLMNKLWSLAYTPQQKATHTAEAFFQANDLLRARPSGTRQKQVIIVITDGKSTQKGKMDRAIDRLKSDTKRQIFGIGIGDGIDMKDIKAFTTSDDMAYLADDFANMQPVLDGIAATLCCKVSGKECVITPPTECTVTCGSGSMTTLRSCYDLDEDGKKVGDEMVETIVEPCCTQECISDMCMAPSGGSGKSLHTRDISTPEKQAQVYYDLDELKATVGRPGDLSLLRAPGGVHMYAYVDGWRKVSGTDKKIII